MLKIKVFLFLFIGCQISCVSHVETNLENLNKILKSEKYTVELDIASGNIAGFYKSKHIIKVSPKRLTLLSEYGNRTINYHKKDSFDIFFRNFLVTHDSTKILQKTGGCGSFDVQYTLYNNDIQIMIKPNPPNRKFYYKLMDYTYFD